MQDELRRERERVASLQDQYNATQNRARQLEAQLRELEASAKDVPVLVDRAERVQSPFFASETTLHTTKKGKESQRGTAYISHVHASTGPLNIGEGHGGRELQSNPKENTNRIVGLAVCLFCFVWLCFVMLHD